jgi:hypothetical protein
MPIEWQVNLSHFHPGHMSTGNRNQRRGASVLLEVLKSEGARYVFGNDSQWSAWWEAIPIEKAGDLFKLRWRNNPTKAPPITRSRFELALICSDAA